MYKQVVHESDIEAITPHKEELTPSEQRQILRLPSLAEIAFDSLVGGKYERI